MIKVDVFIKNKNWKKKISNPQIYLNRKVKYLKNSINFLKNKDVNFSILLAGNKEIKILNKKFRKKSRSTDVLSFPFYDSDKIKKLKKKHIYLGDVILNYYKIEKKILKKISTNYGFMDFYIYLDISTKKTMIITKCIKLKN